MDYSGTDIMKNPSQMIIISIFAVILGIARVFLPVIIGLKSYSIDYYLLTNLILILTYVMICVIYFVNRSFNYKLISQKSILFAVLLQISVMVCRSFATYFLNNGKVHIGEQIFAFETVIQSLIPLVLLFYILTFSENKLKFIQTFPAIIIVATQVGVISIGNYASTEKFTTFNMFEFEYPKLFSALIVTLSYYVIGFFIIYTIFESTNFVILRFNPILMRQNIVILTGLIFFFFITPTVEYLIYWHEFSNTGIMLNILEILQNSSILLITLPNFYATNSSFNLIPQSVEKFLVINASGLPLVSYDFSFSERVLHSDLLVTSSLSAIMTFLSHSELTSKQIDSIVFEDRILRFRTVHEFTFAIIVKRKTKILDSALSVFIDEFFKHVDPQETVKAYIQPGKLKNLQVQKLIEECFGTNFEPSPSPEMRIENQNNPQKLLIGRLVVSVLLALSSQRAVVFQSTTILLPPEEQIAGILIIFFYGCMIYLGAHSMVIKKIRDTSYLFYVNLGIYFILSLLSPGILYVTLTWIFAFLAWAYLIGVWVNDYSRISKEIRFQLLSLAFILDIGTRFVTFGTELLIYHEFGVNIFKIAIIGLIIVIDRNLRISQPFSEEPVKVNQISVILMSIALFTALRFSLSPGEIYSVFDQFSVFTFALVMCTYLLLLLLLSSSKATNLYFRYSRISFLIASIDLMLLLLSIPNTVNFVAILISPISISIICSYMDNDSLLGKYNIKQSMANLMHFVIPASMFVLVGLSLYGGSDQLLIFPIGLFIIGHLPKKLLSYNKVNDNEIVSIGLILLLLISFSCPILFIKPGIQQTHPGFGVMTYNIQYGVNSADAYNPQEMANFIIKSGVSIVGLQEVTRASLINGDGDLFTQLAIILKENGFNYIVSMESKDEFFTNVLFSKFPILSYHSDHYPENVIFTRGFIQSIIDVDGQILQVVVTHLTHVYSASANQTRTKQISYLLNSIVISHPTILMGDFNIGPKGQGMDLVRQIFIDQWGNKTGGNTWPTNNPEVRIDYIYTHGINTTNIYIGNTQTSDHLPVVGWFGA